MCLIKVLMWSPFRLKKNIHAVSLFAMFTMQLSFPKIEQKFSEFSEFGESGKSQKFVLGSIKISSLSPVPFWHCDSMLASYTRD